MESEKLNVIAFVMVGMPVLIVGSLTLLAFVVALIFFSYKSTGREWEVINYFQWFLFIPLAVTVWLGIAILCFDTIKDMVTRIISM